MNKYFLLYPITFLCLHISGALSALLGFLVKFDNGIAKNFNIEQVLHSYAALEIGQYLMLTILLTGLFLYGHYKVAKLIIKIIAKKSSPFLIHLSWASISSLCLLTINTSFFNQSVFYMPEHLTLTRGSLTLLPVVLITFLPALLVLPYLFLRYRKIFYVALSVLTGVLLLQYPYSSQHSIHKGKPNIIFIGIDSLRLELIDEHMPFLNDQLKQATVFDNAYTPFARTYPSWVSIITGRHPVNHKARFNLQPESMLDSNNQYLPLKLKTLGYQSIYASDERRFSNLGKAQGFDKIIGPRTGAADFILGNFADFPLLNMLSILPISKWLLPEIYANRAAAHLYQPSQFSELLTHELSKLADEPLFLSAHFCLAHWPYTFVGHTNTDTYQDKPAYPANLKAIDEQIRQLYQYLSQKGILENSRIVFLSDHGESWGEIGTGLYSSNKEELTILDHGHGMNILSPSSHKVLLALKGFDTPTGKSERLTSLLDISPTISDALELSNKNSNYDGQSLLTPPQKPVEISFESGIVLAEANTNNPDPDKIAKAGLHRFQVLKNGLLRLKEASINDMLQKKQLGLRLDNHGLFLGRFGSMKLNYLLIDYNSHTYHRFSSLSEISNDSKTLVKRFCELYSLDHNNIAKECVRM